MVQQRKKIVEAKIVDIETFCEDLKEVSSSKIMDKRKFHPAGLFSEQIFGPLKNYTCQCGIYHGISNAGTTCKICGVDIVSSRERRTRFGKIILPIPVVNPIFYDLIVTLGKGKLKSDIDLLMKDERLVLYNRTMDDGQFLQVGIEDEKMYPSPEYTKIAERVEAIQIYITEFAMAQIDDENNKLKIEWQFVLDNIDQLLIKELLVLPPDLRPTSKIKSGKEQMRSDEINRFYLYILNNKETMEETFIDILRKKDLYYTYFRQLQKLVNNLYDYILEKLSKKEGLIRGNILGKRIDFSGRAVIAPDPAIKIDECALPYSIILELFKLQISKKLIESGKFRFQNEAIDFIDKCMELDDPVLSRVCEDVIKNEVCLLNRQPSLHRLSLIGFKLKMTMDKVIKIHPLACSGYNADFDGDQMAIYLPISKEAKEEVLEKFLSTKNLFNPSNASLSMVPSQDIILGVYILTNKMIPYLNNKVEYKGKEVTEDIKIFNDCLPEDYPLIDQKVDKNKLISILNDINNKYPYNIVGTVLDKIKTVGFKYSTVYGTTLSLSGLQMENSEEMTNLIYATGDVREQLDRISSKEIEDILKEKFKYSYLIDSGARGTWDQARQIVLSRGFVSNFSGKILETPIKNNLIHGLGTEEFFTSSYGCRKGLLDVAINTGDSGYLSRKLAFSCSNLQIGDLDDCGTTDYLDVFVDSNKKARTLVYRYWLNPVTKEEEEITKENYTDIIGKIIKLRSPIFCKSEKVCKRCYGNLYKILHSSFIGMIAAQSLGEVATQLVLRVFHTSGVAVTKQAGGGSNNMQQEDIISDLGNASRLLHSRKETNAAELVSDIFKVYNDSKQIHHVHFECVVSQLMWIGFKKWRLLPSRETYLDKLQFSSIQIVPSKESWILGFAFSNPKKNILKGILNKSNYSGVLDKILVGKKL